MIDALVAAFPGSRLRSVSGGLAGVLACNGQFHSLRMRFDPLSEVVLVVPAIQDFELVVQVGDRKHGDAEIDDERLDNAYFIKTNDLALARQFLDEESREVMRRQLAPGMPHWRLAIRHGELIVARAGIALSSELVPGLLLAGTIAGALGRWAVRLRDAATRFGATIRHVADRVALEDPALVLETDRVEVQVTCGRHGPLRNGPETLSTRVTAHRASPTSLTWTVVDPQVTLPEVARRPWGALQPFGHVGYLRHSAAPGVAVPYAELEPLAVAARGRFRAVIAGEHDATVWFRGAELDPETLALATQLVAGMVREATRPDGVYR